MTRLRLIYTSYIFSEKRVTVWFLLMTVFGFHFTLLSSLFFAMLTAYTENKKMNLYIQTLPYSKAQIVSAKYQCGFSFSLIGCIGILRHVDEFADLSELFSLRLFLSYLSHGMFYALIFLIFVLPLMYKFKFNALATIPAAVISAAILIPFILFVKLQDTSTLMSVLIIAVTLVLYDISRRISIRIYEKADF